LWQEREQLESLVAGLSPNNGRTVLDGVEDIAQIRHMLSLLEIQRSVTTFALAQDLGFQDEPRLNELVGCAPAGWGAVLRGHLHALRLLAAEVERAEAAAVLEGTAESQRSLAEFLA
jgi:hypothetical protein